MKNLKYFIIAGWLIILLSGCASVQIFSKNDLTEKTGLKFYPVKPYLLVELKSEKDMTVKTSVIYLPDLANPQYLKVKSGIGSSELKMAFTNGILNSYGVTSDSKVNETISSLATLIGKSQDVFREAEGEKATGIKLKSEPDFILYEIVITKEGTRLVRVGEE